MNILAVLALVAGVAVFLNVLPRVMLLFVKFPMPAFMAGFIDNPLRHWMQPHELQMKRQGLVPGMRVLEIGPGHGSYCAAAARTVGPGGEVVGVDLQPQMVAHVEARAREHHLTNLSGVQADARTLPFPDASFDAVFIICALGEMPERPRVLAEVSRVLKPGGVFASSHLLIDPDFMFPSNQRRVVESAGFTWVATEGNWVNYTQRFHKPRA